jgi:hypothetical protein
MVAAKLNPAKTLASPAFAMYPVEVVDAWFLENVGVPLKQCESIKLVIATPGPNDAMFAAVFKLSQDFDLKKLNPEFIGLDVEVDGRACVEMIGPPGVVLHQLEPDTIVISSSSYLDSVIKTQAGQGPLGKYAAAVPHQGNLTVLFAVEPVRPLISGLLQSQINQIPPPLVEFVKIPELLDAVLLRIDMESTGEEISLTMLGRDEDSARELDQIIKNGLEMGRQMTLAQLRNELDQEGSVGDAMRAYADRMSGKVVQMMTPKLEGKRLTITASADYGMYTQLMMMGTLVPVVQRVNIATPRARAANNLKQIGLAMHNHHAAYKTLPGAAMRDDAGKPLLSWRVKLLPFVEEQALWQEFRHDEPWDSDHNIKLLDKMPEVYKHPRIRSKPGTTVYQVPVGDEVMFKTDKDTRFREVLDGLSNTIMVVETDAESAVPWTKPADWEVDMDEVFSGINLDDNGMFTILMSDGAVRSLSREVGTQLLKALLTINGRERIDF